MDSLNSHFGIVGGRVLIMWLMPLIFLPVLIYFERKVSAFMQDRTGPNRASIAGIRLGGVVHVVADVLKLLCKEDLVPSDVSRFYYKLAPFVALFVAQLLFIVMPFADDLSIGGHEIRMQALQLDIGVLWPLAVGALMVYSVVLAGWASNNKFGTLGGLRAAAQMVSYEVALGLAIMGAIMLYGTLDLAEIVNSAMQLVRPSFDHAHVRLETRCPQVPVILRGDRESLRELVLNLLLNALEAAGRTPGRDALVLLETSAIDGTAEIRVSDSGPGPAPETSQHMFEPFVSEKPEGTGLGLHLARQIAEAHGGSIQWERSDGRTVFIVRLPRTTEDLPTEHRS